MPVPVWDWAGKGEEVTVTLGPESRSARAGDDGRWRVVLPPCKAGGPLEMIVKGSSGSTQSVKNVLVGAETDHPHQSRQWLVAKSHMPQ
jgi:sialate O-acetylesterase